MEKDYILREKGYRELSSTYCIDCPLNGNGCGPGGSVAPELYVEIKAPERAVVCLNRAIKARKRI